ncbi:glucan biosynthesis protein G [Devosia sp. ZB163]|uniref:glucan biosynthesis protein n=1 Tax=Devosia sp. ZB163 TaxID=3025938 RepID=UPI0023604FEE|nr:glucan biosynthesis protein G [Devosia sp. ZB163]MDC9823376.1 glucan biosynthesis protein G [Devosia sp. ZB163]
MLQLSGLNGVADFVLLMLEPSPHSYCMHPTSYPRLGRRAFLKSAAAAAALFSTTALTPIAIAQDAETFDFEVLTERMRAKAAEPFDATVPELPKLFAGLDYDGYRKVQFDAQHARWIDNNSGFQVHAFPMGWLFKEPVGVFEVAEGKALPFDFSNEDFLFYDAAMKTEAEAESFPGIAGVRINYPLNQADKMDELVSFLGSSYFRALGRANIYGLSARGLAINSWQAGPEEFPRFSSFWLERPTEDKPLVMYASLEGASVTGAYRFEITPPSAEAQETVMDVTARLFFRADIGEIGIAPLTSMFLFAETNRHLFDDFRPQVHDSNGLMVERDGGEVFWRSLNNTDQLGNTYLWENNPRAFGLYQRDRNFETYQDAGAHYERRPSARVEPVGDWGQGHVRLIEAPSRLEVEDNIVAFWIPSDPVKAGDTREFHYRLIWGDLMPHDDATLAHVVETRAGQGGVSGVANDAKLRKFVVDFAGGPLRTMPTEAQLDVVATVAGGEIVSSALSRIDANGAWRLALDVMIDGTGPVELKANVASSGRTITETWLYQWRGQA